VWFACQVFATAGRCHPLSIFPTLILAQGAKVNSPTDVLSDADKDNVQQRERWFYRSRVAPAGESPADLRYRAHRQKLYMRSLRAQRVSAAAAQGVSPLTPAITWNPLGPAPLTSDSTGTGFQDYGLVSGRTTAVVVDPADPTGHSVCGWRIWWCLAIAECSRR
jgi:hypothetical protein